MTRINQQTNELIVQRDVWLVRQCCLWSLSNIYISFFLYSMLVLIVFFAAYFGLETSVKEISKITQKGFSFLPGLIIIIIHVGVFIEDLICAVLC